MTYKIGSFNLKNLGLRSLAKTNKRDLSKIAQIIRDEQYDIVAFQEILSDGKAFNLNLLEDSYSQNVKKTILMELGINYDFSFAVAENETCPRNEGYGFLWNKNRIRLASAEVEEKERIFFPRMCKDVHAKGLIRRPFYGRFTPDRMPGGCFVEFRLICIHTFYGDNNAKDINERNKELECLLKEVYPQIEDRVYQCNMPSYTVMLGDYNAELWRPWKAVLNRKEPAYLEVDQNDIVIADKWDGKKIRTFQDQFTTVRDLSKTDDNQNDLEENTVNKFYVHDYDHFSFDIDRFKDIGVKVSRVNAVEKYCNGDSQKYRESVSDHVPISLEIDLKSGG